MSAVLSAAPPKAGLSWLRAMVAVVLMVGTAVVGAAR
jgi:hypothetical protein